MEDKIILDKDTFKALSVDTRLNILKLLTQRRYMLSEISEKLGNSNSTIKEHLDVLVKAGLIKQIDEGRKWKYYKLTFKGKRVVMPQEIKVFFTFIVSSLAFVGTGILLLQKLLFNTGVFGARSMMVANDAGAETFVQKAAPMMAKAVPVAADEAIPLLTPHIPWYMYIIPMISLAIVCFSMGYLLKKKNIIINEKKVKKNE